jgi:hypothetical protein
LAGTWKQYSKNAIPQLTIIARIRGELRYFKCPYHANVIKILDKVNKKIVSKKTP